MRFSAATHQEEMSAKILEIFSGHRPQTASSTVELLTDREFVMFHVALSTHAHFFCDSLAQASFNVIVRLKIS